MAARAPTIRVLLRGLTLVFAALPGNTAFCDGAPQIQVLTEEFPPYSYAEKGEIKGLSTEIVTEVLNNAGLTYEITIYPWARALAMAQSAPNTLIYSIGRNAQRENAFQWVGVIAPSDFYFFALANRSDIVVNSLEDAKKYLIGTTRNDVREQYLISKGFTVDRHLQSVTNQEQNILKLFNRRIDITPLPALLAYHLTEKNGHSRAELKKVYHLTEVSSEGYYMAFSNSTPSEIVEKCRTELKKLKDSGKYDKIQQRYLAQ